MLNMPFSLENLKKMREGIGKEEVDMDLDDQGQTKLAEIKQNFPVDTVLALPSILSQLIETTEKMEEMEANWHSPEETTRFLEQKKTHLRGKITELAKRNPVDGHLYMDVLALLNSPKEE